MTEPRLGDQYGQILVGLSPKTPELRDVDAIIEAMRAEVTATPGPVQISFLRLAGGQPTSKPISVDGRLPQDRGDPCLPRLPVTAVWWQAPIVASLIAAPSKTHQAPPAFAGSALANSKRGIPCS